MEVTKKSNATVKRYLQILKTIGLIEFRGSAKTGKYYLTNDAIKKLKKVNEG
jgi:DNA-binding IclR family transcriptional regulator